MMFLNFHGVGPAPRKLDEEEKLFWLDQDFFEAVLDLIRGQSHVRLTFDDGNVSDFQIVLPALLRRGIKASFFICSGRLDQPAFLSRDQVRELHARGMRIGSHGVDHISWRNVTSARFDGELRLSRAALESICGIPVNAAACPFGSYDRRVLNGLRQAGYRFVYTSDGGAALERHSLRARTTVERRMTMDDLHHLIVKGPGTWNQLSINLRKLYKRLR